MQKPKVVVKYKTQEFNQISKKYADFLFLFLHFFSY